MSIDLTLNLILAQNNLNTVMGVERRDLMAAMRAAYAAGVASGPDRDAMRYRWIRDSAMGLPGPCVWAVQGNSGEDCWPCLGEDLDTKVDLLIDGLDEQMDYLLGRSIFNARRAE